MTAPVVYVVADGSMAVVKVGLSSELGSRIGSLRNEVIGRMQDLGCPPPIGTEPWLRVMRVWQTTSKEDSRYLEAGLHNVMAAKSDGRSGEWYAASFTAVADALDASVTAFEGHVRRVPYRVRARGVPRRFLRADRVALAGGVHV